MNPHLDAFLARIRHPFKFRLFLFYKLPAAFFAGVRVRTVTASSCTASVPFKWLSQNPFRSTYFACLSMAAEMSTGILAMAHLHQLQPAVSMLVVKVESSYFKKATGRTYFTCDDGGAFQDAIGEAIKSGEAVTVRAHSTGKSKEGDVIAEFFITWSFKARKH